SQINEEKHRRLSKDDARQFDTRFGVPRGKLSNKLDEIGTSAAGSRITNLWHRHHSCSSRSCGHTTTMAQPASGRVRGLAALERRADRYLPVADESCSATSSGVPAAMIRPPPSPP